MNSIQIYYGGVVASHNIWQTKVSTLDNPCIIHRDNAGIRTPSCDHCRTKTLLQRTCKFEIARQPNRIEIDGLVFYLRDIQAKTYVLITVAERSNLATGIQKHPMLFDLQKVNKIWAKYFAEEHPPTFFTDVQL